MAIIENNKSLKNLLVHKAIRIRGVHIPAGAIVAKSDFAHAGDERIGDWLDLCNTDPPYLEQTSDKTRDKAPGKAPAAPPAPGA